MVRQRVFFARRYRAALLDYLLGNGESGRERAYELGRSALDNGIGLLQILRVHQKAVNTILESTPAGDEGLACLRASEEFLMETLSPFEMTYRGYVSMLRRPRD